MKHFKVGDIIWAVTERDKGHWFLHKAKVVDDTCQMSVAGQRIDKFENLGIIYHYEPSLVFSTQEEAQKVFDKIDEQVKIREKANNEILNIVYKN